MIFSVNCSSASCPPLNLTAKNQTNKKPHKKTNTPKKNLSNVDYKQVYPTQFSQQTPFLKKKKKAINSSLVYIKFNEIIANKDSISDIHRFGRNNMDFW